MRWSSLGCSSASLRLCSTDFMRGSSSTTSQSGDQKTLGRERSNWEICKSPLAGAVFMSSRVLFEQRRSPLNCRASFAGEKRRPTDSEKGAPALLGYRIRESGKRKIRLMPEIAWGNGSITVQEFALTEKL